MGITTNRPAARCLDLTRLISRIGRGPWTGIDRVEFEYLQVLSADDVPLFALVRMHGGYAVFDPAGVTKLMARISGSAPWGRSTAMSWLLRSPKAAHLRVLADVSSMSVSWSRAGRLGRQLRKVLPAGTKYLNVGHSNISGGVFEAFQDLPGGGAVVMLHDTIPLDFPELQRPETVAKFAEKLRTVARHATLVICNSEQTHRDVARHMSREPRMPDLTVAHLGVQITEAPDQELPGNIDQSRPYFVTIGTIEPRKNHSLLLDIWQRMAKEADAPQLLIVGQRGWNNQTVFDRLDQNPPHVIELGNLSDGAVAAVLKGARALLFPSFAEGFGLPAAEAALLDVPVICNKLAVFREVLGEYPIYADVSDLYDWETKIRRLAYKGGTTNNGESGPRQKYSTPTWDEHFNLVLRLT